MKCTYSKLGFQFLTVGTRSNSGGKKRIWLKIDLLGLTGNTQLLSAHPKICFLCSALNYTKKSPEEWFCMKVRSFLNMT